MKGIGLFNQNRLQGVVRRMQFNRARLPVIGLDRGLAIHQGNDGLAIPGRALLLHPPTSPERIPSSRIELPFTRKAKVSPRPTMLLGTSTRSVCGMGSMGSPAATIPASEICEELSCTMAISTN
jgi:hypothetical protein